MHIPRSLSAVPSKLVVLQKMGMMRAWSHLAQVYLVNEHPKCGATWLKLMLADALDLKPWTKEAPVMRSCVMQDCTLTTRGGCRTVLLFRDGRDVMVSYYYHALFLNDYQNGALVQRMRALCPCEDYDDIRTNLLPFMKTVLANPVYPYFNWIDFVRAWAGREDLVRTRYEDLRRNTPGELARLVHALTGEQMDPARAEAVAEHHSMAKMRQRRIDGGRGSTQKAQTSFVRKGSVGGWTDSFTDEALDWFEARAGDELQALGYALGRPKGAS